VRVRQKFDICPAASSAAVQGSSSREGQRRACWAGGSSQQAAAAAWLLCRAAVCAAAAARGAVRAATRSGCAGGTMPLVKVPKFDMHFLDEWHLHSPGYHVRCLACLPSPFTLMRHVVCMLGSVLDSVVASYTLPPPLLPAHSLVAWGVPCNPQCMVWCGGGWIIAMLFNFNWSTWIPLGGIGIGAASIFGGLMANHHMAL
jgi:hypothetical protein